MAKTHDTAVVLDFETINAQMVAKAVRELSIYCEVLPWNADPGRILAMKPRALIYQRGAAFGNHTLGLRLPPATAGLGLPVLDFGKEPWDIPTLETFLLKTCGFRRDWTPKAFIAETTGELRKRVGSGKVLLGMSGGVDSSVCAALLHLAVGNQLTCVFVDHGLMRLGEPEHVEAVFRDRFGIRLVSVNAEERFLHKLRGVTDPERKRKIIGEEFIRVFEEEARKLGELDFFVQGTIYPDIIESGRDGGKPVKAHHNVGGLPERIHFKGILEPVRNLFKDEVRNVGGALGLPPEITGRQPFPGPGLAVRCLGEVTRDKVRILRKADAVFRHAMDEQGFGAGAGQYFAVLTGAASVGVSDHARTYGHVIALRAVDTRDFMTARVVPLPPEFLTEVAERIAADVPGVSRVVYDVTPKPPATIEWE